MAMTSSIEAETRNFWRAARAIRLLRRGLALAGVDTIEDHMAEVEAIVLLTDSPMLRARSAEVLAFCQNDVAAVTA